MSKNSLLTKSQYIIRADEMSQKWTNPRLYFIKSIQAHTPNTCPECEHDLVIEDEQVYCPHCGLVTQDSIPYVAGFHIVYPHGLRLG